MMTFLHLTDSQESLQSICENGLLFTYNPTEVLCSLLNHGPQTVESFDPGGMICFTELPYTEAKGLFDRKYGVSVDKEWAIEKGAREVVYIDSNVEQSLIDLRDQLAKSLSRNFPKEIESDQHLSRWLIELAVTKKEFLLSLGGTIEMLRLMESALWFQKDSYSLEKEWRIRSGKGYPSEGMSRMDKTKRIELLLGISKIKGVAPLMTVELDPNAVVSFYTPAGKENIFKAFLSATKYRNCLVNH